MEVRDSSKDFFFLNWSRIIIFIGCGSKILSRVRAVIFVSPIFIGMKQIVLVICCLVAHLALGQTRIDSLLRELDSSIARRDEFKLKKIRRIDSLKNVLAAGSPPYLTYSSIYDEYKSFNYDSAFFYARRLQLVAGQLRDPVGLAHSRMRIGFVLVSAGMFNEALDTLQSVDSRRLPDSLRSEYYYVMARACYDLADFNRDDYYRQIYTRRAQSFIDSALALLPANSAQYLLMKGLRHLHRREMQDAEAAYEKMIADFALTAQEFAIAASTLSYIYLYSGEPLNAKEMLIRAAIADIRSSTKETLATLNLADLLFREGDVGRAYKYIRIAMEDADFYGARQRKMQVATIFPVIEGREMSRIESKRKTLVIYSAGVTIITLIILGLSLIIYRQNKTLQRAKSAVSQANDALSTTNQQLQDANKIKEEYIWYYFNTTAEYITKLDALKKTLDMKLMTRKIEDLRFVVDSINVKREREQLYHNFDQVFLKLFPDFVNVFNSLLKEEDRVVLKDGQLLNTELRIFALIRMGIHDHERIAKILDYSVTTIYTYKTRVRSKSIVSSEEFDRRINGIRAI
ncbi:MAG TPA: DUF6377 domain-containing protein [Chryseosolibacter sp.]|nr:DUF6377 domain-containing protein [Chryseosolibacter sp.]